MLLSLRIRLLGVVRVKINQNALTELFSCNKGIRQGDGWSKSSFIFFICG